MTAEMSLLSDQRMDSGQNRHRYRRSARRARRALTVALGVGATVFLAACGSSTASHSSSASASPVASAQPTTPSTASAPAATVAPARTTATTTASVASPAGLAGDLPTGKSCPTAQAVSAQLGIGMRTYDSVHTAAADDCSYVPTGVRATSTTDAPLSVEINGTTQLSVTQYKQQLLPTNAVCDGLPHTMAAGTNTVSRACSEEPSLGPGRSWTGPC